MREVGSAGLLTPLPSQGPQENRYELPGGRLKVGEDEIEGLRRKLDKQLQPDSQDLRIEWEVSQLIGMFYR